MATWKVIADRIKLFPHSNSDHLLIGKIGKFQVVVGKENGYQEGDVVVFAPERSILPEEIRGDYTNTTTGASYLQGENHDRVGSIRLRGELSEGVTLNSDWVRNKLAQARIATKFEEDIIQIPLGNDLSRFLGITKYTPPIPEELIGKVSRMDETAYENRFVRHDVELFHMFKDEFILGEIVELTEKIHGSQLNLMKDEQGELTLTSKTLGSNGFIIDEDENNPYWRAVNNSGIRDALAHPLLEGLTVQIVGEMIPCHKGYSYGASEPTLKVFKGILNGEQRSRLDWCLFDAAWAKLWVPLIARIPWVSSEYEALAQYANGREQVSGKELHIREGVVITPNVPRNDSEGHGLAIKYLNAKFKGSADDIS